MYSVSQTGDDLEAFMRSMPTVMQQAEDEAARMAAFRARKEIAAIAKTFKRTAVWKAKGFASTIRVKRVSRGEYRVYSTARYKNKRTQQLDLLWVFDNAPVVSSGFGKSTVAIPIPGGPPIAGNGRRVMWPSEALAAGWLLDFIKSPSGRGTLVLGRANRFEPWRPMWVLLPRTQMPKVFDLTSIYERAAAAQPELWGEAFDRLVSNRSLKIAA